MAFNDLPELDGNAVRCEESVLYIRQTFSMKYGFISRDQNPDYGIDFLVELVSESGGATSKDFAVQIKSCIESKTIEISNDKFIALEFKTSRLGHLCRRLPAYGIIVFHDIKNNTVYYDFVENLVNRATMERNGEEWKEGKDVTIHFPIANILNQQTAKSIYDIYTQRFKNNDLLTAIHGPFFDIPFLASGMGKQGTIDYSNPAQFLQTYGGYLINHNEYRLAFNLLSSIPFGMIVQTKELLFLSTIVYSQCGYYLEARSFISFSLSKYSDWDEQQSALIAITDARLSFIMGLSTIEDLSENLAKLSCRLTDDQNTSMIESQLLHIKLLTAIKKYGCVKAYIYPIVEEIKKYICSIDDKKMIQEAKYLLKLDCAYYLGEVANFQYSHDVVLLRMKETLNITSSFQERIEKVQYTVELFQQSYEISNEILKEADKNKLETTKAHALYIMCHNFFQFEFSSLFLKVEVDESQKEAARLLYVNKMDDIIHAAYLFQKNNLLEDAHNMLCLGSDINRLYKSIYGSYLSNYDESKYFKIVAEIEKATGLTRKKSLFDVVAPFRDSKPISNEDVYSDMTDADIDKFSLNMIETMNLPIDRLINLKKDLTELRQFHRKRHCRNLILLQNLTHTASQETLYRNAPLFLFDCLKKKWRTGETTDTSVLLDKMVNGVCKDCSEKVPTNV